MALTSPALLSSSTRPLPSLPSLSQRSGDTSLLPHYLFSKPPQFHLLLLSSSLAGNKPFLPTVTAYRGAERQREILESYGLDPSDFATSPSSSPQRSRKGRKEVETTEKGKRAMRPLEDELKTPRTTHRLLQVLGGKARRRKLLSPKGMDVRPMMEVVRGAAFDILQVAGGCPVSLRPGRWLDLYSGTGSVGIEAMSRGCSEAHFVEMDPWVVSEVLRPNLDCTGFVDNSVIHTIRVESFLEQAGQTNGMGGSFDYISVTPPYTAVDYSILMAQIGKSPLIGKDSFILVEYPLRTSMLESCGHLVKIADRRFGRTNLALYGPAWAQKKRKSEQFLSFR